MDRNVVISIFFPVAKGRYPVFGDYALWYLLFLYEKKYFVAR